MADRRRKSPDGSDTRGRKDPRRSEYQETRMRATETTEILSSSESSSSSSYIDISRSFPLSRFGGLKAFFTAPSERRRTRKRRSSRLLKLTNSSSSSVNSDLAYGTGFIKRTKSKVRSRKGKEIDRESRYREGERRSSRDEGTRTSRPTTSGRDPTDAELLALGANFRKLARESNRQDLRGARNGRSPAFGAVNEASYGASRGLAPSQIVHVQDSADDGWESASDDDGSETSVDSGLAFGEESTGGWSFFGRKKHKPLSKKNTIVDPQLFGPANSLNGIITRPVGFGEVSPWNSNSDFGQLNQQPPYLHGPRETTYIDQHIDQRAQVDQRQSQNGSQIPLQQVYPIPTADPSRFDAARSSVVSGAEPYYPRRPDPVPIQQPQPFTPVSQSMYEPIYSTRSESGGILKKTPSSTGRGKSIAEAALVGVAVAAGGAAISASRDKREDIRRDDEVADLERERLRRRENERNEFRQEGKHKRESLDRKDSKDDKRSKRESPKRDDRKENRRDKDRHRDKRHEESHDEKEERRERRRQERRAERSEVRAVPRRSNSETAIATTAVDPFQFQIPEDPSPAPEPSPYRPERKIDTVPTVVTVDREPDFSRKRSSSIKQQPSSFRSEPRKDYSQWDERDQRYRPVSPRDETFHKAETIYQETERSTAPIEAAAIGAAVAAVATEGYRESRSEKRRDERPSERRSERRDYDDRDYKPRGKEPVKERDPIQEEADRAYREIVMARKIASQVIRERTPSPDRSVVHKYDEEEEEEVIRIVTPPGMEDHKKQGLYDAPNADFQPDHVLEDPRELQTFIPSLRRNRSDSFPVKDPGFQKPRPLLNLVRPTPVPSPVPEKQAARNERARSSSKSKEQPSSRNGKEREEQKRSSSDDVASGPKGNVVASTVSKGVTWGENETKHFDVESPSDHKDEFISNEELRSREPPSGRKTSKEFQSVDSKKGTGGGWAAMAAGIIGAGAGAVAAAASSSETPKSPESKSEKDEKPSSYEYRGVVVETEPESPPRSKRKSSPPSPGPKPNTQPSGSFEDDLDFTATVAAGLQDTGFNPNIVIDDPSFHRRTSPPGSNEPSLIYRAPFAETVSDLGTIPSEASSGRVPQGYVMGEAVATPQDWRSASPPAVEEEPPIKLSKKGQKKRDKARRQSSEISTPIETPAEEFVAPKESAEEPEAYFEAPKLSKREQKKRDKAAQKQSLAEDNTSTSTPTPLSEPYVADKIIEEPESYFETPKKGKMGKKGSSTIDSPGPESPRDRERTASMPIDIFDDVMSGDKKKSKRDSERFDSPSRSATMPESPSEFERSSSRKSRRESEHFDSPSRSTVAAAAIAFGTASEFGISSSKKSKHDSERYSSPPRSAAIKTASELERSSSKKSKGDSERYDSHSTGSFETASELERPPSKKSKDKPKRRSEQNEVNPADIALPPSTPSESSRDGDFDDTRRSRKPSMKDSGIFSSADRGESRLVASAGASHHEDDEPRRKKKHRSSTRDDDDARSIASEPALGEEPKKKDKKGGSFFGLFGSKSEVGARTESPKESKDDFDEVKKKKKSKRHSTTDASSLYGDMGSQPFGDLSKSVSNGHSNGSHDDDHDGEKRKSRSRSASTSSKKDSFLGKAGTLGAGVGLAGAAIAIATQLHPQTKAGNANESVTAEQPRLGDSDETRGREEREPSIDPEIHHLDFRPSIDPQYGDLLPLPPSEPASPNVEPLENLPKLPDSRPGTPEDERIARERSATLARRNLQETPIKSSSIKSPSHSAVPLKFIMGNRSQPSSPGFIRSPPSQSPAAPSQAPMIFPRTRPQRPTSWDSSKEYKPLFLVESNRRGSAGPLPALPDEPSAQISREFDPGPSKAPSSKENPLSIDTLLESSATPHDLPDSQQSMPKASSIPPEENYLPSLPYQSKSDEYASEQKSTESFQAPPVQEKEPQPRGLGISEAVVAGLASTLGYFASPSYSKKIDSLEDELPFVQRRPSPVDPMTKDRSSYLLRSSPSSKKSDDVEIVEDDGDSPKSDSLESSIFHSFHSIQERDGSDIFASALQTPLDTQQERGRALESLSGTPITETWENPFFTKSKKDKKGKSKDKGLSRSSTQDDLSSQLASSQEIISEEKATPVDEPSEDFFFTKSKDKKKDRKSKGISRLSTQDDASMLSESNQDVGSRAPPSLRTKQSKEPVAPKSKKEKKKAKKHISEPSTPIETEPAEEYFTPSKPGPSWRVKDDTIVYETVSGASRELSKVTTALEPRQVEDVSTSKKKKDRKKDKKRSKSSSSWRQMPDEEISPNDQPFHSPIPVSEPVFKPIRQVSEDAAVSDQISQNGEASKSISKEEQKDDESRSISPSYLEHQPVTEGNVLEIPATAVPTVSGAGTEEIPLTGGEHQDDLSFTESRKFQKQDGKTGKMSREPEADEFFDTQELLEHATEGSQHSQKQSTDSKDNWHDTGVSTKQIESDATRNLQDTKSFPARTSQVSPDSVENAPQQGPDIRTDQNLTAENTESKDQGATSESLKSGEAIEPTTQETQAESMEKLPKDTPVEEDIIFPETKKGKKKKGKTAMAWEPAEEGIISQSTSDNVEANADQAATTQETPDEFVGKGGKKGKKRGKKSHSLTEEDTSTDSPSETIELEQAGSSREVDETSSLATDANSEEKPLDDKPKQSSQPSSKKNKKKSKEQSWEPEPEEQTPVETIDKSTTADAIDESHTPEVVEEFLTPTSKKRKKKKSKKSQVIDLEEQSSSSTPAQDDVKPIAPENTLPIPEVPSDKPTPVGGPGGWPATPATPETPLTEAQPLETQQLSDKSEEKSYFPAAASLLPLTTTGAAILGLKSSGKEAPATDDTISKPTGDGQILQVDTEVKQTPDGLAAGYKEDQLTLARQLKEEFGIGSKKSKKDKKKRQSLPVTPKRELSRSRPIEELGESSRARSLSIGPTTDRSGGSPGTGERKNVYSEEQLELARQLKAEFEAGNKKSKKDKKGRLSRSATQDDSSFDQLQDESQAMPPADSQDIKTEEPLVPPPKGDGFAAGYQEDQLSLARQLQSEFGSGSKKSKKGKKSRSTSRTPQDEEFGTDYFGDASQPLTAEPSQLGEPQTPSEPAIDKETTCDGLDVGYSKEQLEYTRQLNDELGSGSSKNLKKDKKGKKRESLLRSNTDDDLTSDSIAKDVDHGNVKTPASENVAGPSEPTAEPGNEFALVGKKSKKDKKRKKRESSSRGRTDEQFPSESFSRDVSAPVDDQASPRDSTEKSIEEPVIPSPEEEIAPTTKKSKKDKKDKKRGSVIAAEPEEDSSSVIDSKEAQETQEIPSPGAESLPEITHADPEFEAEAEFAPVSKKSKRDKSKKRGSVKAADTKEDNTSAIESENFEPSRVEPVATESQPEPTVAPQDEDEFATVNKMSKKDEGKKRGSMIQESSQETLSEGNASEVEKLETVPLAALETSLPESLPESPALQTQDNKLEDIPHDVAAPTLDESSAPKSGENSLGNIPREALETTLPESPAPELADDLFTPSKKSKKNTGDETAAPIEVVESSLPESPSAEFEEEFGQAKKGKKNKKGKKHDSVQEIPAVGESSSGSNSPDTEDTTRDLQQPSASTDNQPETSIAEPEQEFAPVTKSRKDKTVKKRGSPLRNEIFNVHTPDDLATEVEALPEIIDKEPSKAESEPSQALFEEDFGFTTKPMKDKKGHTAIEGESPDQPKTKNDSAPIEEPSTPSEVTMIPDTQPQKQDKEIVTEPQELSSNLLNLPALPPSPAPEKQDDEFDSSKKSKKDKENPESLEDIPVVGDIANNDDAPSLHQSEALEDIQTEQKAQIKAPEQKATSLESTSREVNSFNDTIISLPTTEITSDIAQDSFEDAAFAVKKPKDIKEQKNSFIANSEDVSSQSTSSDHLLEDKPIAEEKSVPEPTSLAEPLLEKAEIPEQPINRDIQVASVTLPEESAGEPMDARASTSTKKSKKNKRNRKDSSRSGSTEVSGTTTPQELSLRPKPNPVDIPLPEIDTQEHKFLNEESPAQEPSFAEISLPEPPIEEPVDEWVSTKKSKDSSKAELTESSGPSTPLEPISELATDVSHSILPAETLTDKTPINKPLNSVAEASSADNTKEIDAATEPNDEWALSSTKKSKKDKKKHKSGISTPTKSTLAPEPKPSSLQVKDGPSLPAETALTTEPSEGPSTRDLESSLAVTNSGEAEKPAADEWTSPSTKKSKKDKKKRQSGLSTPTDESSSLKSKPTSSTLLEQPPIAVEDISRATDALEAPVAPELEASLTKDNSQESEDVEWASFTAKKSKEDKKSKSGGATPSGPIPIVEPEQSTPASAEQVPEPSQDVAESVEVSGPLTRDLEKSLASSPKITPEDAKPTFTPVTNETTQEPIEEEWGSVSTKKSKKDKKNLKSGTSTPVDKAQAQDTAAIPGSSIISASEREVSGDAINIDSTIASKKDQETETQEPEQTDEASALIAKKPKKGKKGKRASRGPSVSGPSTPSRSAEATATQDSERSIASPVPFEQDTQTQDVASSNIVQEPIQIETKEEQEVVPSNLSKKGSKKDKRKRQATVDSGTSGNLNAPNPPTTSWVEEVEEAEVERKVPIIEEIANDESLAHIASTTEAAPFDDFSRPTKKGKKGKKKNSVSSTSSAERSPTKDGMQTSESSKDHSSTAGLAAAGVAALLSKSVEEDGLSSSSAPVKKLSKKEQRKLSIDKRSQRNGIFDDPLLWEDSKPKVFAEENKGVEDGAGNDGFWSPPQEDEELAREQGEMDEKGMQNENNKESEQVKIDEKGAMGNIPENIRGGETGTETQMQVPRIRTPRPGDSNRERPMSQDSEFLPGSPTLVGESQTSGDNGDGGKHAEEELLRAPSNQDKDYGGSHDETINRMLFDERDFGALSSPEQSLKLSRNLFQTPPPNKVLSFEESPPIVQEHISEPPQELTPHKERRVASQEVLIEHTQPLYYSGSKFAHSGFSDLPPVDEESPIQLEAERSFTPHAQEADFNRDSGLVTDSPTPPQRGFADGHEHLRDSGVHLRDFSPAAKVRAPVSSSDDAIARLSWPSVNEDTETVDLHKSQRPPAKAIVAKQSHGERRPSESHDSPKSQEKRAGPSFSQRSAEEHKHPPPQESRRPKGETATDFYRSQRSVGLEPTRPRHETVSRDTLPSQSPPEEHHTDLHRTSTIHGLRRSKVESIGAAPSPSQEEKPDDVQRPQTLRGRNLQGDNLVRQRLQRFGSPDYQRPTKPKEDRYSDLTTSPRPAAQQPKGFSDLQAGAAIAGASLMGFAAGRKRSQENRPGTPQSLRTTSNPSCLRTPEISRPESVTSNRSRSSRSSRSSGTPPLRRSDRQLSGDLRSLTLSQQSKSKPDLAKDVTLAAPAITAATAASVSANSAQPQPVTTTNPTANEGRVRAKDMADVYDGFGEGRMGSPRSPTRPHSMRRRQSMQVLDLEARIEQLASENRMLAEYRAQAERQLRSGQQASSTLVEKNAEIDSLKRTLEYLQKEVTRLTEVNEGLSSANVTIARQHGDRYSMLEQEHAQVTRELAEARDAHISLSTSMEGVVMNKVQSAVQDKDREIAKLCADLDAAKEQIREMQRQILASKVNEIDFLTVRDEDHFDNACQQLCQHVQQWVLRFSKFSDMRACRLTGEINNDKTIDRLDNAILDGSNVDNYLSDRIKRRDVFMSMTMTMVWEFVFTRYLFGMDREQRQKLKSLEKILSEVGPAAAVHQWRATTLTLLSKRQAFAQQREQDTKAVVHAILETLSEILPPPSHLEQQIEDQLMRVMKSAVDLSIQMRTQRAEYMMLPPLQPEYDANGELASKVTFNAALMNERSGDTASNEDLEAQKAIVRIVLFPLVVKKGDDRGEGDEEIVVCPAQVLVAKPKKQVRVFSPSSMIGGKSENNSMTSMQSSMPENVI